MHLGTLTILTTLALTLRTHAHTRFTTLHINGVALGDGVCIRQDLDPGTTTNFVPSITGPKWPAASAGPLLSLQPVPSHQATPYPSNIVCGPMEASPAP